MAKAVKIDSKLPVDFHVIGIVSQKPIFNVGFFLNELLRCQLAKINDLELFHAKLESEQFFSIFSGKLPDDTKIDLIKNRGEQGLFLEECKQVDYFVKIFNADLPLEFMVETLKQSREFIMVQSIDVQSLKQKNRLFYEV